MASKLVAVRPEARKTIKQNSGLQSSNQKSNQIKIQIKSKFKSNQNSNQIKIQITPWITPKRVTSWRGPSPRHCARATQLRTFEEMSHRWRVVGNTVSDLTGPRFELLTSRSRDERVTARLTGWSAKF